MTSFVIYEGNLQTSCTHIFSGNTITTDAPKDNRGNGSSFSPTDMMATSLAACILTTMGIYASDNQINMKGARAEVVKIMASAPRRIAEIQVKILFPAGSLLNDGVRKKLQYIASNCPVALSLHPDVKQTVELIYE